MPIFLYKTLSNRMEEPGLNQLKEVMMVMSKTGMIWVNQKSTALKRKLKKCVPEELTAQVFLPLIFCKLGYVLNLDIQ